MSLPGFLLIVTFLVLSNFVGFFGALVIFGIIFMLFKIYEYKDRKRNPEKWKEIDKQRQEEEAARKLKEEKEEEEDRPRVASKYWNDYQSATKYIPKSEWILMSKEEKADVFRRRETVKEDFFDLPIKTRAYIVEKYKLDTNFPNV